MKIFNVIAVLCLLAGALTVEASDIPPEKLRQICEILVREQGRNMPDFCSLIPGGREQIVTREANLGRYYRDEQIPLRQLLNIDRDLRGSELAYVEVHLQDAGRGGLALLLDGRIVDGQRRLDPITRLTPRERVVIGNDIRSIQLRVDDKVFIRKIVVAFKVQRPGGGNQGGGQQVSVLQQAYRQNLRAGERLDIGQIVNLYRHQGREIQSIEVQTSTQHARGAQLVLSVNGAVRDRRNLNNTALRTVIFNPGPRSVVGRDVNSLVLDSTARIYIERITVRLAR